MAKLEVLQAPPHEAKLERLPDLAPEGNVWGLVQGADGAQRFRLIIPEEIHPPYLAEQSLPLMAILGKLEAEFDFIPGMAYTSELIYTRNAGFGNMVRCFTSTSHLQRIGLDSGYSTPGLLKNRWIVYRWIDI